MGTEFVNENEGGENHVECNLRCFGSDVAVEHGHFIYRGWSAAYLAGHCCDRVSEQFFCRTAGIGPIRHFKSQFLRRK